MLMFDSLRKNMVLPCEAEDVIIPNFKRLKEKSVAFDNFYVGSMPCMPARRELQTGRYNFMHRSWGPMEPWDNSAPEILKKNNIYTHIVTDHKHYWREGGATYHTRYNTYEFIRGQEGDAWKGVVDKDPVVCNIGEPESVSKFKSRSREQDLVNRSYMKTEEEHPMARTVNSGLEFIDRNKASDNWFLQIECFDPHEPFFVPQKYLDMYGVEEEFNGWPPYYYNTLDGKLSDNIRNYYKALVTMCDAYVGKVLDKMDELNLWDDTLLIVTTDHGFLLGEHEWWGKNVMPIYN
jgi:arylsulfatase A-like enzyme